MPYILPGLGILSLAVFGALTQNIYFLYALIIGVCVVVGLVAFDKFSEKHYPYLLFAIGLALLYQTTLMSAGLVGTDIHTEYYFYQLSASNGWDPSQTHAYNSCIGTVIIAPFIAKVLHIDGVWVFKAIYPFLFSFVPVLLYYVFRKQVGAKMAFLATFFFLIVPTWSLEMIGLPRQMLAELMLALCLFFIVVSRWRLQITIPLILVCAILGLLFHYAMGSIIIIYLVFGAAFLLLFKRRTLPVKWLSLVAVIVLIVGFGYYGLVGQGFPLYDWSDNLKAQVLRIMPKAEVPTSTEGVTLPGASSTSLFAGQEPLVQTALGLDLLEASPDGKAFRVLQFLTQGCIVLGCGYLVWNRKKYSPEFLAFAGVSAVLIGACIFIPGFSAMLNVSRFYHIALFLLAPALVLGGKVIFRNLKILTLCLLIPYFLFTSGCVFEAIKVKDISYVNIPYSIALSHERVEVGGVFTKNDMMARDWAVDHASGPIYADVYGVLLLAEKMPITLNASWTGWDTNYLLLSSLGVPDGAYIFLRERNEQRHEITIMPENPTGSVTGMRVTYGYSGFGLDKMLVGRAIIHREGDAVIYGKRRA